MNGRSDDAERRQRSVQYFSHPDWPFSRFRDEAPGGYEAGANIGADEWIRLRVEVQGARARLFINQGANPALVVDDLKLGPKRRGAIGLWVDTATIAYFANLRVMHTK